MPLKVKFSNKNINEDIKTKILAIKDFDKIPNDYIELI